jgi:hypothetical protein
VIEARFFRDLVLAETVIVKVGAIPMFPKVELALALLRKPLDTVEI